MDAIEKLTRKVYVPTPQLKKLVNLYRDAKATEALLDKYYDLSLPEEAAAYDNASSANGHAWFLFQAYARELEFGK